MPWRKDRPPAPGELEFHLPNEQAGKEHDEAWREHRAEKLAKRHEPQ